MEEAVNAISVENGEHLKTFSSGGDDKLDSDFEIIVPKCETESSPHPPSKVTAAEETRANGDSCKQYQGQVSENTDVSAHPAEENWLAASQGSENTSSIVEDNIQQDNPETVDSNAPSFPLEQHSEGINSNISGTDVNSQEVLNIEDQHRLEPGDVIINMENELDSNLQPSCNSSDEITDNIVIVPDTKLESLESELSLLTGDEGPPPAVADGPLENEFIISELSVIHGEAVSAPVSNGSNIDELSFVTLSPEEILKNVLVSSNQDSKGASALRKLEATSKVIISEQEPALNNSQLLAILEDDNESLRIPTPKEEMKWKDSPARKSRKGLLIDPVLEKTLALKQLKELPTRRSPSVKKKKIVDVKIPKVSPTSGKLPRGAAAKKPPTPPHKDTVEVSPAEVCDVIRKDLPIKTYSKVQEISSISNLISDWSDDDGKQETQQHQLNNNTPEVVTANNTPLTENITPVPSTGNFVEPTPRRVSRVIKKKVIYDPDNPDSYKFASSIIRKETPTKKVSAVQDENTADNKTPKPDAKMKSKALVPSEEDSKPAEEATSKRLSVSPVGKKKVLNTSSSKKRKLTEVDRLLMDEGAVNMIYQLERSNNNSDVPELALKPNKKSLISISKEKRALVSKAKIIKQAVMSQSNDSVKVFRARKENKAVSNVETASQKAAGLRSSMQSPSLSEMSAAGIGVSESKIIRRHSSSSFSSGGLSPRPQSPILESSVRAGRRTHALLDGSLNLENDSGIQSSTPLTLAEIRKRKILQGSKKEKVTDSMTIAAVKQKKLKRIKKLDIGNAMDCSPKAGLGKLSSFTQLTIDVSDNIAHIVVRPTNNSEELYDLQVLSELTEAVRVSGSAGAVLLTSGEGALCGGLDLRGLLQPTLDQQRASADQLLDTFRELMVSVCECRAAVVCGVGGACAGPGVALLTLCDLALASDRATFCVSPRPRRALPPEGAALLARPHALPPQVARDLVMSGRKLTASEALQRGMVARTLWPDRFLEEVRSIAADLALHPSQSFGVIKSVLRRGEVKSITAALQHESRRLVDLWCTPDGQDTIRHLHSHL